MKKLKNRSRGWGIFNNKTQNKNSAIRTAAVNNQRKISKKEQQQNHLLHIHIHICVYLFIYMYMYVCISMYIH